MERKQPKSKYFWGMVIPLILIVLIQNAANLFVMEIVFVYDLGNYVNGSYIDLIQGWIEHSTTGVALEATYIIYSIIASVVFFGTYKKNFVTEQKLRHPFKGIADNVPMFIAGLIIFSIGMQYVCLYLSNSVAMMFPQWLEDYENLLESSGLLEGMSIPMGIYAVILAPICEELAFRGLAFKNARKIMPVGLAIVVQALLFAGFHGNMLQGSYTFIVGLGLGYVMYRYDNIIVTIIIHMIYNFIGSYLNEYLPYGGNSFVSYFAWFLGSLIVGYIGVVLLQKAAPGVKVKEGDSDI